MAPIHHSSQRIHRTIHISEHLNSRGNNLRNMSNINSLMGSQNVLPQFRSKTVCILSCRSCQTTVCLRGMKAILLADTRVELYSTDSMPLGVQHISPEYTTNNCNCKIQDVACLGCGNVLGYNVTTACFSCLADCNNGHYWMLYSSSVTASERIDPKDLQPLLWAFLPTAEEEARLRNPAENPCR
ncbi:hypothetical protein K7432_003839 [Basidiobolus ranarum]|uniref:Protein FAM72A n=1 Tax=Basidiobolus ranarum TaxID=34480 RepID=A0ABR2W5K6_9FUNG